MASSSALTKQLDDITECPICTEVFTDPRVLPCIHTYCLKCIDGWCKGKQPGDEVHCALCRKGFRIPDSGLQELPKNFFIEKLLNVRELAGAKSLESPCDVCSNRNQIANTGSSNKRQRLNATFYCAECQEKLCDGCCQTHRSMKVSRMHKIVKLGEQDEVKVVTKCRSSYCDKHPQDVLRIYCFDCKLAICIMCFVSKHKAHNCSDIEEIAEEFRQAMFTNAEKLSSGVQRCRDILENAAKSKSDYIGLTTKLEKEICDTTDELKACIESHKQKLLGELEACKQTKLQEIEELTEEVQRHLVATEGFKKYVDEMLKMGTSCDIVCSESDLRRRTEELLAIDSVEQTVDDLSHVDITFTSYEKLADDLTKLLGYLSVASVPGVSKNKEPTLVDVVPTGNVIRAMTSLGNDVFVVRDSVTEVEVYDATTLTLQRRLNVTGMGTKHYGLASCGVNTCLYVSNYVQCLVHRVDLSGSNAVMQWRVGQYPAGLSVNGSRNVLVTCQSDNKLQEYTTRGTLVREIILQDVTNPWHAVQLSSGQFVVSVYNDPGGVVLIDSMGRAIQRCTQTHADTETQFGRSTMLDVTSSGFIVVADFTNKRIVSINPSLSCARELHLPIDGGLQSVWSVHIDESRDRLYVSEYSLAGRLLVFENITGLIENSSC